MTEQEKEERQAQKAANRVVIATAANELSTTVRGLTKTEQVGAEAVLTWLMDQQTGDSPLYLKKSGQAMKMAWKELYG